MTTSFAHFTRGHLAKAVETNAGGFVLALVCAAQIPWCWWSACRGRLVGISHPTKSLSALVMMVVGVSAANWLLQIFGD